MKARKIVTWTFCVSLAAVFAAAAVPKLIDPGSFANDLLNYRLLPESLVGLFALFVPALELMIASALLWPRYQRGAALLSTLLLVGFAAAMAQARIRGIDLSCGCFGAAFESKVSWFTVARSLFLAAMSAAPLFWSQLSAAAVPETA
jgi:predicted anti-sigma-YlaC factor YlaD